VLLLVLLFELGARSRSVDRGSFAPDGIRSAQRDRTRRNRHELKLDIDHEKGHELQLDVEDEDVHEHKLGSWR
jgi:hypothetical protein